MKKINFNNVQLNIRVKELIQELIEVKNKINLKKIFLYEEEITNLSNELNISYQNAKEIVDEVYLNKQIKPLFNKEYVKINNIAEKVVFNYKLDDFVKLTEEEYFIIYEKDYNNISLQ